MQARFFACQDTYSVSDFGKLLDSLSDVFERGVSCKGEGDGKRRTDLFFKNRGKIKLALKVRKMAAIEASNTSARSEKQKRLCVEKLSDFVAIRLKSYDFTDHNSCQCDWQR